VSGSVSPWVIPDDGIVDQVAVEIMARGERRVRLTRAERLAVAALVLARGGTVTDIKERLHVDSRIATALAAEVRSAGTAAEEVAA
jgi:hypothetical protein